MPKNERRSKMSKVEIEEKIEKLSEARRFSEIREIFLEMEAVDIAPLFELLPEYAQTVVYRLLPKELAAEVFVEMDGDMQERLIISLSDKELKETLDELYLDDTVDIIEEMPATVVKRILRHSDPAARKQINELLKYPKDSAGSIMTPEYVDLKKEMTVSEAFDRIRKTGVDKETVYTCYVTDKSRHLLGVLTVKELLLAKPQDIIGELMETNVIYIGTGEDKENAANLLNKYGFLAVPVVDGETRLVGIVTFDDAMDVMKDESTEDIEKMAAITPVDKPYLKLGVFTIFFSRIPWLMLLMVSATFTGMIISGFEEKLALFPALIGFIPMLMDTGGNSGSQASVTVIRAISLGDIEFKDTLRVIWKELRVSVLCSVSLAAVCFLKIWLVDHLIFRSVNDIAAMAVICVTLAATVIVAKLVGCTMPLLAKKAGFDPAVMASPFITTIVDVLSLLIYFGVASLLLFS